MIREIKGDLLESKCDIIAHQVNCKGVMGAGVARQIRDKILSECQYQTYQKICRRKEADFLLGKNLYFKVGEQYICNMFAENIPTGKGLDTNYEALDNCFKKLKREACKKNMTIAIPGYIGCGLAGGDWKTVYAAIILPLFKNSSVDFTIVYHPDSMKRLWEEFHNIPTANGRILREFHGYSIGCEVETIKRYLETIV